VIHRLLWSRDLSRGAYVLRFTREGLDFAPGQHVTVGRAGSLATREYSVYSAPDEPYLEVLVKEVHGGLVSAALRRAEPGDPLDVEGPFGAFVLPDAPEARLVFVATGTGISPFHCFVLSRPGLDYRVLHGVRDAGDLYDREVFDQTRFVACLSRGEGGDYSGRVTGYLADHPQPPETRFYLCGSADMIYDAMAILRAQGVARPRIAVETYY
jgi:ferredoxin/flavodoxin---NADP+ reductase